MNTRLPHPGVLLRDDPRLGRGGGREERSFTTIPHRPDENALRAKGITIHQFLLSDGLPHPYPGQVADGDLHNDYGRF